MGLLRVAHRCCCSARVGVSQPQGPVITWWRGDPAGGSCLLLGCSGWWALHAQRVLRMHCMPAAAPPADRRPVCSLSSPAADRGCRGGHLPGPLHAQDVLQDRLAHGQLLQVGGGAGRAQPHRCVCLLSAYCCWDATHAQCCCCHHYRFCCPSLELVQPPVSPATTCIFLTRARTPYSAPAAPLTATWLSLLFWPSPLPSPAAPPAALPPAPQTATWPASMGGTWA